MRTRLAGAVYLYCLGAADHPEPSAVTGLAGAPVRSVPVQGFTAWVSESRGAPHPSLEALRTHNAVLGAATRSRTPLPMRFGQWFDCWSALEALIAARRAPLELSLRHVLGAVEFGTRILDPAAAAAEPDRSSGKAYLEGLSRRGRAERARARQGADMAEAMRAWLGPLARDQRVDPGGDSTLASVAHLVDRHDTGTYQRRIRQFPSQHPELRFLFSGPWPPYGFAV